MEFIDELKQDNALLKPHIDAAVNQTFDELVAAHDNFAADQEILRDYLHNPGRGIGGSLVLRMAEIYKPQEPSTEDIAIAAATEIMNAGILIIDDVLDNSDFRKSQPTVHKDYELHGGDNMAKATQLGVLCMQLASIVASGVRTPRGRRAQRNLQRGALLVTAGQLLESHVASNADLHTEQSIRAVHGYKTGHYSFDAPMQSGLILAGVPSHERAQFSAMAQELGMVFQLQDDVNAVFGNSDIIGKPIGDDARLGLYTMIVHMANNYLPKHDLARFHALHGKPDITDEELEEYKILLQTHRVNEVVREMATTALASAEEILSSTWQDGWNQKTLEYLQSIIAFLKTK